MRSVCPYVYVIIFFFNDTATTEIYTLSLHDALPIYRRSRRFHRGRHPGQAPGGSRPGTTRRGAFSMTWRTGRARSEEHTSELQSRQYLVCRLLLEKKTTFLPYVLRDPIPA